MFLNGRNYRAHSGSVDVSLESETLDDTTMEDTVRSFTPGLRSGTVRVEGFWEAGIDDASFENLGIDVVNFLVRDRRGSRIYAGIATGAMLGAITGQVGELLKFSLNLHANDIYTLTLGIGAAAGAVTPGFAEDADDVRTFMVNAGSRPDGAPANATVQVFVHVLLPSDVDDSDVPGSIRIGGGAALTPKSTEQHGKQWFALAEKQIAWNTNVTVSLGSLDEDAFDGVAAYRFV